MSIIRVGLAETKKFAEGYDLIFGKKTEGKAKEDKPAAKTDTARKKRKTRKK